ncbi:hypothetical protein TCAL_10456, partial [Tigriopus californicus]|eukprot:TCALIF_10456-PA protein Name:"Similar to SLC18A2 Synaptic vesicular amine transporter (Homo sapiens)" AED:0.09 eAED:0.09 QI:8/0/0/1/0.33/0.75/4/0/470
MPDYLHELEHPFKVDRQLSIENHTKTTSPRITQMYLQYPGGPPFLVPHPNASLLVLAFQKSQGHGGVHRGTDLHAANGETNQRDHELLKENGRVGTLFASKAIVQLLANPLVGFISSKYGYQQPLVAGSGILFLSSILFAGLSKYPSLLLARSIQGIGSACITVAGMGLMAKIYPEESLRSKVMGHLMGGIALGVIIGYPFGGFAYSACGKTMPFIITSLITGVLFLLNLKFIGSLPMDREYTTFKTTTMDPELHQERCMFSIALLRDHHIIISTVAIWLSTSVMAMLEPCLPIWLMNKFNPPTWQLGVVFLPDSIGYFVGANFFGPIALHYGRWSIAMAAMICVGFSAIMITLATVMWDLIFPHYFLGLGIGIVDSSLMPLLAQLADINHGSDYGSVYALAQTSVSLAYSLGPLFGAHLAQRIGFPKVLQALGIINVAYSPILFLLKTRVKDQDKVVKQQACFLFSYLS